VLAQASRDVEIEYIIVDGGSSDGSLDIIDSYKQHGIIPISGPDNGPADALNKGFRLASGDVIAWLNADDFYLPGSLARVKDCLHKNFEAPFCFGRCLIVDEKSNEIRRGITRFKELFFPISSRFTYRCINYISQPALFFRKEALRKAGPLKDTMIAAWDYDFVLRFWAQGHGEVMAGSPLACFRWHEGSISGTNFQVQFKEEYEAVKEDAGRFHPAVIIHFGTRWMIVGAYSGMKLSRRLFSSKPGGDKHCA